MPKLGTMINVIFLVLLSVLVSPLSAYHYPKKSVGYDLQKEFRFDKTRLRLYMVGQYMAAHKYFGADYRYLKGDITKHDQVFYRQFPSTPLQELHTQLARQCRRSVELCVRAVYKVAKKSATMQKFFKSKDKKLTKSLFAPFNSVEEMFKFRQTAAYFLCSFAANWKNVKDIKPIQYGGKPGCLDKLVYVNEVSEERRKRVLLNRPGHIIKDPRASAGRNIIHNGMMCALLWFCPDPCLGRKSRGNVFRAFTYEDDLGNRCRNLPDSTCKWDWESNGNFDDLIRNKLNITCKCESDRPGLVWNNLYELCVDKDECNDKNVKCDRDKVCRNTIGSNKCMCAKGFRENGKSGQCEQMMAFVDLSSSIYLLPNCQVILVLLFIAQFIS